MGYEVWTWVGGAGRVWEVLRGGGGVMYDGVFQAFFALFFLKRFSCYC